MIKFLDLKKINAPYEAFFQEKVKTFFDKSWYILGDEVKKFETNFAKYNNAKYCIGVGNGLDALVLIFKAYIQLGKLKKGDEVIVPANTYVASILAILQADLVPVLVEPENESFNLDSSLIQQKITTKTKAILVVHLYGQLANMESITAIAIKNNLLVIEDAAQSHGAMSNSESTYQNSKAYSFYPGKNLGAIGDAGAITTDDADLAKVLFSLRNYGSEKKYYNDLVGFNSRLDELQALFLNIKLPNLDADNNKRRSIAKRYITEITNPKIKLPFWDLSNNHVFHLFVIRILNREKLQAYLQVNGIESLIHYPIAPHKQKAFAAWNSLSFPITEKIHDEVLSIPISPVLTEYEVSFIIQKLNRWIF